MLSSNTNKFKLDARKCRHARVRAKISGTAERPRVVVFKSNRWTYAQAIDDVACKTVASVSDRAAKKGTKTERAAALGTKLAELLKTAKIASVVFDKGGFAYHGRVKAVADGLREGGIRV
ncbi:MAG TPA: 50S ribosomal protein L18 [Candidatus Paceibacterota bacterium]|nr:50S ribosomal protein L18 [Candidatus Paceibacterota bacterium]